MGKGPDSHHSPRLSVAIACPCSRALPSQCGGAARAVPCGVTKGGPCEQMPAAGLLLGCHRLSEWSPGILSGQNILRTSEVPCPSRTAQGVTILGDSVTLAPTLTTRPGSWSRHAEPACMVGRGGAFSPARPHGAVLILGAASLHHDLCFSSQTSHCRQRRNAFPPLSGRVGLCSELRHKSKANR